MNQNTTITVGVIRALMAGKPGTSAYKGACDCAARCEAAGTTLTALNSAGMTLQCGNHGEYTVADHATRAAYKAAHGWQVDARVTSATAPSGLRPGVIPAGRKDVVEAWTANVAAALAGMADSGTFAAPKPEKGETSTDSTTGESTPRKAVPSTTPLKGAGRYTFALANIGEKIARAAELLRAAPDPRGADIADKVLAWGMTIPADIMAAGEDAPLWDVSIFREGDQVELLSPTAVKRAATLGGSGTVGTVKAVSPDGVTLVDIPGRARPLALAKGEFRRFTPPTDPAAKLQAPPSVGMVVNYDGMEGEIIADRGAGPNGADELRYTLALMDGTEVAASERDFDVIA